MVKVVQVSQTQQTSSNLLGRWLPSHEKLNFHTFIFSCPWYHGVGWDGVEWGGDNTKPVACSAAWTYLVLVAPLLELVLCVLWIRWGGVGIIPNLLLALLLEFTLYLLLRCLNLSLCVLLVRYGKMWWGGDNTKPVACSAAWTYLVLVAPLLELVLFCVYLLHCIGDRMNPALWHYVRSAEWRWEIERGDLTAKTGQYLSRLWRKNIFCKLAPFLLPKLGRKENFQQKQNLFWRLFFNGNFKITTKAWQFFRNPWTVNSAAGF